MFLNVYVMVATPSKKVKEKKVKELEKVKEIKIIKELEKTHFKVYLY